MLSLKKNNILKDRKTNIVNLTNKKVFFRRKKLVNLSKFKRFKIDKISIVYYYLGAIIIFLVIIFFVLFGPNFFIKTIDIIKSDKLTNIDIAYKSIDDIRGKSIFLIQENEIENKIKKYQKNIKEVKKQILLPDKLKINLISFEGLYNTFINSKSYILTENGTLVPSKIIDEKLKTIEIKSRLENNDFLIDYKDIFDEKYIKIIKIIEDKLEKNILNIKLKNIIYYEKEREVHFIVNNGTIIIFDLVGDIQKQVQTLVIFNNENFNLNKPGIIYIDLRIKDKIFYCKIEDEYKCRKNMKNIYPS